MRYFLDTEFHEDGPTKPIEIISLGLVAEDGRELYLENLDYDKTHANNWLKENVLPHLNPTFALGLGRFAPIITKFIQGVNFEVVGEPFDQRRHAPPEFWGYYADYDWVVFCQLFGRMIDLPKGFPMYCRDLKQWADQLGVRNDDYPKQADTEHNALNDARWNKQLYDFLVQTDSARLAAARSA